MKALLIPALILPWILIAAGAWFVYQIFTQYGRALLNIDELRARLLVVEQEMAAGRVQSAPAAVPTEAQHLGLAPGAEAPDFTLPDLEGRQRSLKEFLGQPLLLVFFSPTCGWCTQMAPRLGELPEEGPRVLLVSSGDPNVHRQLAEEHNWRCDVLLEQGDVMMAYGGRGTPTGYLIEPDGRIASELAMGSEALFALYEEASGNGSSNGDGAPLTETLRQKAAAVADRARRGGLAVKDTTESRLVRDGLPAGTKAPDFALPDIHGKRRSLKRLRGKRVLLVFSDVGCGPCHAMAPDLNRLHAEHREDNLEIVMISRGDREENRRKAEEQGLEFPVLLQRAWEISKEYGMFATPIAYLIDEKGAIAKDVAVGADAILQLVEN